MAIVFKAPAPIKDFNIFKTFKVFLAGSIDMGKAEDWQPFVTERLSDLPISIFNPRRDDWDSTWVQDISNKQFAEQVNCSTS